MQTSYLMRPCAPRVSEDCMLFAQVANIVAMNTSLVLISLSLNQIIRSGIPIFTAILGIAIEKIIPTGFEFLSLVMLTLGVVLSIWEGSLAGSSSGISIAIASTVCGAAMLNFSGKVGCRMHSPSTRAQVPSSKDRRCLQQQLDRTGGVLTFACMADSDQGRP